MKKITVYLKNVPPDKYDNPSDAKWVTNGNSTIYQVTIGNTTYEYPSTSVLCVKTEMT